MGVFYFNCEQYEKHNSHSPSLTLDRIQGCLNVSKAGGKASSEGASMHMYVPHQG